MPPDQFEALKADIAERGVLVPIDVDEEGHILDGHHRYRACVELAIADFPTIVRPGMTEEDRRIFARKSNMLRRHLGRDQVRRLIADQLKDTPAWANNRIAAMLGVDGKTVQGERLRLEATSEIPKFEKLVGQDCKERPVKQQRPPAIMAANADDLRRIWERLEKGASLEEIEGFLSEQGFQCIALAAPDPFAHCDEAGKRDWYLFALFLADTGGNPEGAWQHVEWVLRREFKTPAEWLGEEGEKSRKCWGMGSAKKSIEPWERFAAVHAGKSIAEIEALFGAAVKESRAA